jgi:hypothetical protein
MLFSYTYVPHLMEKMQTFIDFIFDDVWCKAPTSGAFCLGLFDGNAELKEVMTTLFYGHTQGEDFFYSHVQLIYEHFAALTPAQIAQFKLWYQSNNDIEKVCANDPAISLVRYADIAVLHKELSEQLEVLFKGLYDRVDIAALKKKIGSIDDHYKVFMGVNKSGKCPFCGIADMQGIYHSTREAYDHYLPKGLYPFNSINFRNLVPACHNCNSSYKTSKDPAFTPKDPAGSTQRRKVFYPFSNTAYTIDLTVNLKNSDLEHLKPEDMELQFGPPALGEEIETWKDVYGIVERYKAKCCSDTDGKYWLAQILDEWNEDGRLPEDYLKSLARQANKNPFAECNFLKKAFLDGCDRVGLFA